MITFPRFVPDHPMPTVLRRRGFTIVELMVAAAITIVVLGLMVQVTFSTLKTFDQVTGTLSSKAQAQTIFDYLRRDFESIVWKRDGQVWLLATVQRDQDSINGGDGDANINDADWEPTEPKPGNSNPGTAASSLRMEKPNPSSATDLWLDLKDYRFGQAGVWLRFFTNQVTLDSTTPAPTAVSYQIVRMTPQPNSRVDEMRYLFFRSSVRPGSSQGIARSVLSAGYDLSDNLVNGYNTPTATNSGVGEPGCIRTPDREQLLATNVIDFGVRFWRRDPANGQLTLIFPADGNNRPDNLNLGYAVTTDLPNEITSTANVSSIPYGTNLSNAAFNTAGEPGTGFTDNVGYPDYVEVMVRILTEEGARLIAAFENGDAIAPSSGATPTQAEKDAYWWTLAEQHSVVYTDRMALIARPF